MLGQLLGSELDALADALLELGEEGGELLLLVVGEGSEAVDFADTVGSELDVGGEVLGLSDAGLDEGSLDDTLLSRKTAENGIGELSTGVGHAEGGRAGTSLGLDDLIASELDALGQGIELLLGEGDLGGHLGEEGENGDSGVSTDDGDVNLVDVLLLGLGDEGLGTGHIEGGDTKDAGGVKDSVLLEGLGDNGDGGVHGVGDDEDERLGGVLGDGLSEGLDNGGVLVEEVVTGHAGLPGETSGDHHHMGVLQGNGQVVGDVAGDLGRGADVGQISGNSWGVHNVVQRQVADLGVLLQKKRQRLANASSGAKNGDLVALQNAKKERKN